MLDNVHFLRSQNQALMYQIDMLMRLAVNDPEKLREMAVNYIERRDNFDPLKEMIDANCNRIERVEDMKIKFDFDQSKF